MLCFVAHLSHHESQAKKGLAIDFGKKIANGGLGNVRLYLGSLSVYPAPP